MGVLDWILVIIRWGHALSAVAWVGGGAFYLLVLRPAIRRSQGLPPDTGAAIRDEFRGLVTTAIAVLLLTGAVLSVARLTSDAATIPYAAVLGVKIAWRCICSTSCASCGAATMLSNKAQPGAGRAAPPAG